MPPGGSIGPNGEILDESGNTTTINGKVVLTYRLGSDEEGLDAMDRKVLETILIKFSGGPVGIDNLATAIGEERDVIEDVYEPFLIQKGFLQRTRQGRVVTQRGGQHMGLVVDGSGQRSLF